MAQIEPFAPVREWFHFHPDTTLPPTRPPALYCLRLHDRYRTRCRKAQDAQDATRLQS
jgi:hypothetical protein